MVYETIYHNLQINMVSVHVSLKLKGSCKIFPQEAIIAVGENHFALELNEKEVIELLDDLSIISAMLLMKQLFHLHLMDMR